MNGNNVLQVNYFLLLYFVFEKDHILALEQIEKKIGQYDFFTKPFRVHNFDILIKKYPSQSMGIKDDFKVRFLFFSDFKKLYQFKSFYKKTKAIENDLIEKRNTLVYIMPGYLNETQVISSIEDGNDSSLRIDSDYSEKIELIQKSKVTSSLSRYQAYDLTTPIFSDKKAILFFNDARSLLDNEKSK